MASITSSHQGRSQGPQPSLASNVSCAASNAGAEGKEPGSWLRDEIGYGISWGSTKKNDDLMGFKDI